VLENRGGIVARLEGQIVNREPIILPYRDAKHALLSKDATVHFILDALGLAESLAPKGRYLCLSIGLCGVSYLMSHSGLPCSMAIGLAPIFRCTSLRNPRRITIGRGA
jgi:hypothetical protein